MATATSVPAKFQVMSLEDSGKVREYRKRRPHKKTAGGCSVCKVKKVKCDEGKPSCLRCRRNDRQCQYGEHGIHQSSETEEAVMRRQSCLSTLSSVTLVPYSTPSARNGISSLHLMQHLNQSWTEILNIQFSYDVVSLSRSDPLVRHSMLALSASHLRHKSPDRIEYRVAEHFQQSLALNHFTSALMRDRETIGAEEICNIIVAGVFLNMLAFTLTETSHGRGLSPFSSWVFDPATENLGWLTLQAGMRPLMRSMPGTVQNLHNSLAPIFLGSPYEASAILRLDECLQSAPTLWKEVFDMIDASPCDTECELSSLNSVTEIIKLPLAILAFLRNEDPAAANVTKSLLFVSKIHPPFRALLLERNEKALWIFGYWLGLMCRFRRAWWCQVRVHRDYEAIGLWLNSMDLDKRPGLEGQRWKRMMHEYRLAPLPYVGVELSSFNKDRDLNGANGNREELFPLNWEPRTRH